jgi:type I restriction enzyme S subunit
LTFAGFLVRFRPRPDVDARFLGYVMQSRSVQEQIQAEAISSTIQNLHAER